MGKRNYYSTLDEGLAALKVPASSWRVVREVVSSTPAKFWIPAENEPYLAVLPRGADAVAFYIHKRHVDGRVAPSTYVRTQFDAGVVTGRFTFDSHENDGKTHRAKRPAFSEPATCPSCHLQLAAIGVCGTCD